MSANGVILSTKTSGQRPSRTRTTAPVRNQGTNTERLRLPLHAAGPARHLAVSVATEPNLDGGVRVISPVTNVPRTNLIDAFQRLQSARKATDPEDAPSHREGDDICTAVGHENDPPCSACTLRSGWCCRAG